MPTLMVVVSLLCGANRDTCDAESNQEGCRRDLEHLKKTTGIYVSSSGASENG